jgi:UDP-N-acetylglucosamine diphosphorylase/glucosamine-1-phosphate N-acetyltransferase
MKKCYYFGGFLMNFVLFDDEKIENFFPVTLTRSTGDLRVGILKLRQRISGFFNIDKMQYILPVFLEKLYQERHPEWKINSLSAAETVFINSRLKVSDEICSTISKMSIDSILLTKDGSVVAAKFLPAEQTCATENLKSLFSTVKNQEIIEDCLWENLWEMINSNAELLKDDFDNFFYEKDNSLVLEVGVTALNPYQIWIGEGAEIKPGVVLDASEGPIVIDEEAKIMANSVIVGPVYIGKKSVIKALSKIYEGTSIGPVCKIGGEVEESIIQAYSNKQHEGFLGHSYLGEWVNLGADTNNSDLKNNYKTVKSYFYPLCKKIDTGWQFLGAIIGDHVKTGINTTINTGCVIGVGCNLYGKDVITDFVPSFSWGEMENLTEYKIEPFLETAATVKKRRKLILSENETELYKKIQNKKQFTLKEECEE